jgi:Ca2+-binding EF-hand superfamily protein
LDKRENFTIEKAFRSLDQNGDGFITVEDVSVAKKVITRLDPINIARVRLPQLHQGRH